MPRWPAPAPTSWRATVATPLERHLGQIADVTEMTSSSSTGAAHVTLQFGLNRDIDGAARDVEAAINAARADLPSALRSNPTYHKVNPADAPMLILALTSKTLTPWTAVRRRRHHPAAEALAGERHRPGTDRWQLAACGARGAQPQCPLQVRHRLEDVRAALAAANANTPKARWTSVGDATRSTPMTRRPRRRSTATWSSPTATARPCAWRTWARCSTRSRMCATSGSRTGRRRCWSSSTASRAPTSSTRSIA